MPTDKSSHIVTVLLTLHDVQPSHGGVGFGPMSWRPTMRAEAHETPVSHTVCRTGVQRRALGARLSNTRTESSQSGERSIFKLALDMYYSCTMPCRQTDIRQ